MKEEKILEDQIIMVIKTVEDPEIPVNIYELGLIYFIKNRQTIKTMDSSEYHYKRRNKRSHSYNENGSYGQSIRKRKIIGDTLLPTP